MNTVLQSIYNLSLPLLVFSNLTNTTNATDERSEQVVFRLSKECVPNYIRLDEFDNVEVTSIVDSLAPSPIEGEMTCTIHFMTGNSDHGICIREEQLYFNRPNVDIKFYTSKIGPDKILRHGPSYNFRKWCTRENLVTMEITASGHMRDQREEFGFRFEVFNESKTKIPNTYYLDSFKYCNLTYDIESNEELAIVTQRYPPVLQNLPTNCQLSLTSSGSGEYEQLCVTLETYRMFDNCHYKLLISGFHQRYWPGSQSLGCNDRHSTLHREEICSADKKLQLTLTRFNDSDTGFYAKVVIKSKKHPKWKLLSREASELVVVDFMKGLVFFISAINSLAALFAAMLATMCRHPKSFWKEWVESMKAGLKCESVHYHVSYPEPSTNDRVEEITEAKAY